MTVQILRDEYNLFKDHEDEWGENITWRFAVAEWLHHNSAQGVPDEWQFGHSPFGYEDSLADCQPDKYVVMTIVDLVAECGVTEDDLIEFGHQLDAERMELVIAGKDY